MKVLNEGKSSHMIGNFDSTQIGIGELGNDRHFVLKDALWDEEVSGPIEANTSGEMVLFTKLYTMITASGELAPLIFIIAKKTMEEGKFEWHKVKGLGRSSHDTGFLVFCKTRAPPKDLLDKIFKEWIVDFVDKQSELGGDGGGFSLSFDGERGQINVAMEPHIIALYENRRIQCCKLPPGCTGTTQPCDNKIYKGAKTVIRAMTEDMVCTRNELLEKGLKVILDSDYDMSAKKKSKIVKCILTIMYGIKKSWTSVLIESSFATLGQYPLDEKIILTHCKRFKKLTVAHFKHIVANLDLLAARLLLEGGITDSYMDQLGIPETVETPKVPYDKRTISRQRPLLLGNLKTIHRFREVQIAKNIQKDKMLERRANASIEVPEGVESERLMEIAIDTSMGVEKIVKEFLANTEMSPKPNIAAVKKSISKLLVKVKVAAKGKKIWQERDAGLDEWVQNTEEDFGFFMEETGDINVDVLDLNW
jgi:hypothetical protein